MGVLPSVCKKKKKNATSGTCNKVKHNKTRNTCVNSVPSSPPPVELVGLSSVLLQDHSSPFLLIVCVPIGLFYKLEGKTHVLPLSGQHMEHNAWYKSVSCVNAFHTPRTMDGENRGYPVLPSPIWALSASSVNFPRRRCPVYRLGVGYYV